MRALKAGKPLSSVVGDVNALHQQQQQQQQVVTTNTVSPFLNSHHSSQPVLPQNYVQVKTEVKSSNSEQKPVIVKVASVVSQSASGEPGNFVVNSVTSVPQEDDEQMAYKAWMREALRRQQEEFRPRKVQLPDYE